MGDEGSHHLLQMVFVTCILFGPLLVLAFKICPSLFFKVALQGIEFAGVITSVSDVDSDIFSETTKVMLDRSAKHIEAGSKAVTDGLQKERRAVSASDTIDSTDPTED